MSVVTPVGYRWVTCSLELSMPVARHRHLIRKGKEQITTECGATGMPASVWRGNSKKPACLECMTAWTERHPSVEPPAPAEVSEPPRPIRLDTVEPAYRAVLTCTADPCTYCLCPARRITLIPTFDTYAKARAHGVALATRVYGGSVHTVHVESAPVQTWTEVTS